jgi:hypothetical protein
MKKLFSLLVGLLIIVPAISVNAQKLISNTSVTGVCYAGDKVTRIYIPPPDEFFRKAGSKSGGSVTIIYSGFTSQAKIAMEYSRLIQN